MNIVKKFFDSQRRHCVDDGKLHRWYPFFEAMESIFFASDRVTEQPPHTRDNLDVKRYMAIVVFTLIPLLFFGMYNVGYQAHLASGLPLNFFSVFWFGFKTVIPLVLVSYIVGFGWEILFAVIRRHEISEGVFVTAMLFPLTLPPTTPLWQVALGMSFGVVIGKEIFGGTGRNFLNPALTGRAFLFFAYPGSMSGDAVWTVISGTQAAVDTFSGATPLAISALTDSGSVEAALSKAGYSFSKLFLGLYPDSLGASSALLCLIGAAVLIFLGIASYRIILGDIIGVLFAGYLLNVLASDSSMPFLSLNQFYHMLIGGAAFGIAFMTTDTVYAPDLHESRWIYGFLIGALTVLIWVFNPAFPEGIMLAILFMNVFAPLLDHIVLRAKLKKRVPNV